MDCKETMKLTRPFIKKEMPKEKLEPFLQHIRTCKDCHEELEINYTVHVYMESLDRDWFSTYDLKGAFEAELKEEAARVRWMRLSALLKDLLTALAIIGILVTGALQLQAWGIL